MTLENAAVPLSELLPGAASLSVLLAFTGVFTAVVVMVTVLVSVVSEENTVMDENVADVPFITGVVVLVKVVLFEPVLLVNPEASSGFVVGCCVALCCGAKVVD